jgi:hypothetical protein
VTGILAVGFIKTSVSFFYLQVFRISNYRPAIIVWIVFMALWTIGFFTAFMAICGDNGIFSARSHMSPVVQARECGSTRMLDFGVLISGTISDLVTVLISLPLVCSPSITMLTRTDTAYKIWSLHLRTSEKLFIAAVFLIGLLYVTQCKFDPELANG